MKKVAKKFRRLLGPFDKHVKQFKYRKNLNK